jgi:dihydroorotate dehydrogenase
VLSRPERPRIEGDATRVALLGTTFSTRVGIAAGMDKGAELLHLLDALGAGFVEVGSVTAKPWAGNPGRTLARLPEEQALWNRLGLPGPGADVVARRLRDRPEGMPVGVNVAATPGTEPARKGADLAETLGKVGPRADWVTVNVSCPNLGEDVVAQLDASLAAAAQGLAGAGVELPPALLKLPPDLGEVALARVVARARDAGFVGAVAVNTRPRELEPGLVGGVSGAPLLPTAIETIRDLRKLWPEAVLVGVGGVRHPGHVHALRQAGADLVQVYSALVQEGPGVMPALAVAGRAED